jgi:hypothetical protein
MEEKEKEEILMNFYKMLDESESIPFEFSDAFNEDFWELIGEDSNGKV